MQIKGFFRAELGRFKLKDKLAIVCYILIVIQARSIEEIKKQWGKNKRVPKHLEDLFYSTIVYYPELKDTYLIVVETKFYGTQHTLRAYPPLLSLPNKREDRVYPIVINLNKDIPISFYSMPSDEQKGMLAHELAHILDYTTRSSLQIIGMCLRFTSSRKFICQMEHLTDRIAISKGCGESILLYRKHLLSLADARHSRYIRETYLTPVEIREEMKKYPSLYDMAAVGLEDEVSGSSESAIKKSIFSRVAHSIKTVFSFFPAITEMMVLVYAKRIHEKPDWYA